MSIPWHQFFSKGMRVAVQLGDRTTEGTIADIDDAKVVLTDPLAVLSTDHVAGMQVRDTPALGLPEVAATPALVIEAAPPSPSRSLATIHAELIARAADLPSQTFSRESLLRLIEEARNGEPELHRRLSQLRDKFDNAIKIGEVDKKFTRMQVLIREAKALYLHHGTTGLALLMGLLYQTMSDMAQGLTSCFVEGVEALLAIDAVAEAREFMLSNGRPPLALNAWKHFSAEPEVVVRVLMHGFGAGLTGLFNRLEAAAQARQIADTELTPCTKNALLYAYLVELHGEHGLGTMDPDDPETASYLLVRLMDTCRRLRFAGATANTTAGAFAISVEGATVHIVPLSLSHDESVPDRMTEFEASIDRKAHVRTQGGIVASDLLESVQRILIHRRAPSKVQAAVLEWANRKLSSRAETIATTAPARPKPASRPSPSAPAGPPPAAVVKPGTYSAEVTRDLHRLGVDSPKADFDAMEAKLRSFADKPGPRQESAVMDLISFLSRKDVNKIDEALAAASQHKSLFQGEKRAKFLNMFAPLLVKGLRYDNAITHYEQLLQLRPTRVALVYNQIAFCHLKQERFVKALANAQQAEALSRDPIDHTPAIRSQVLAHVGLRNWDEARAALDRGRWLADSVRGVLQEVIDSAERGEDASSSLSASLSQEFELGAYDRDAIAFMVQRSPYLSSLLDANQYEGVNIRLQRDDGSFYVATDHRKLVIGGLQEDIRKARKFGKEAYFRIQERCLSLACLFRDRAYDTEDLDEAEGSREGFIQYAALALIYKAMVYERHTALPDYLAMLYTESLTLLARREGESEGSADEYRTCLNGLIIACVAGVRGTEDVSERNRSFIGSQSSNALHDDYVAETFKIAFTLAPDALLTGLILSVANSGEAANSLSSKLLGLLRGLRLEEEAKSRLQTLFNLARSGWTLERYLNECVSQTRATGELVKTHLDALVFQLTTGTESELIQELLGQLSTAADSPSVCYSDAERLRIIISVGQHALSMMSAKDFSVAKESYDKAVATINGARQAIEVNPTKASFELIGPMLPTLAPALDGLLNNRYLGALPRLTLTDDASADGYAPLNNRINVQLRLHNGGRTVASAIRLAFTEDAESRRLYSVQSGDTTDLSIGAGRSECVPITLFLTEAGSAPDTLMDLKISASYKTIRDEEQTTEFATLSIGIQSDGAWTDDIPNPYNSGTELEPRSTGVLYGREGDILSITQQMSNRASGGDAVLIYGQYRCGKSSLKNYVVDGLMKKDNNLVVASLSAKAEWTHRDFSFNVLNEIRKSFREHDPAISLPGLEVYAESVQAALNSAPGEYLQDQLEEIGRLLNDRDMRLLLVIDEFGRIFESPALATSFMQYWKGLMALRVFKTIAIAHDVITEQIRRNENEFAVFQARQLNYISQRATTALVQEPMHDTARDRDRILPDAVEYIWWLTAGQVWYIQMLCHQVVIDMNLYKYQSVNRTRAQEAVRAWAGTMASHDLEGKFHPMFRSGEGGDSVVGDDDAKSVLRAIAEAAAATGGVRARRVDVHQKLQEMYLGPLDADTILASLTARWVVDHDEATDSFEIRVKLYHEYLLGRL